MTTLAENFKARFKPWIIKQDKNSLQKLIAENGSEFAIFIFHLMGSKWKLLFDKNFNLVEILESVGDSGSCHYFFAGFTLKKKTLLETAVFSCVDSQNVYRFNSHNSLMQQDVHRQILLTLQEDQTLCLESGLATSFKAVPYYSTLIGIFPEEKIERKIQFSHDSASLALFQNETRWETTKDVESDVANDDLCEEEILALFASEFT